MTKIHQKHAYLILAHQDDLTFRTLIDMLDHPDNDIFIHMDKKLKNYQPNQIKNLTKHSNIYHCTRTKVSWGAYSQINAEVSLLETAIKHGHYAYYHLVSGQDLPIKTQTDIHDFFNKHLGQEFIRFQSPAFQYENRIKYYYFFQEQIGKTGPKIIRIVNKLSLSMQRMFRVNRNKTFIFKKALIGSVLPTTLPTTLSKTKHGLNKPLNIPNVVMRFSCKL